MIQPPRMENLAHWIWTKPYIQYRDKCLCCYSLSGMSWHLNFGGPMSNQKEPVAQIVTIIAILCFSQHQNTCTGFQTNLGLYLHSNGVKHQQIELLSRLGLIVSYDTVI